MSVRKMGKTIEVLGEGVGSRLRRSCSIERNSIAIDSRPLPCGQPTSVTPEQTEAFRGELLLLSRTSRTGIDRSSECFFEGTEFYEFSYDGNISQSNCGPGSTV